MKIFIFEEVENLTSSYHSEGGLVIIANDLNRALEMAKNYEEGIYWKDEDKHIKLNEEEIKNVIVHELKNITEEKIFVFPNAGCC